MKPNKKIELRHFNVFPLSPIKAAPSRFEP